MDQRIFEVEQMIAECNNQALAKKQWSLKTAMDWEMLMGTIQKIQKAVETEMSEAKQNVTNQRMSELACSNCGTPLKSGAKFCRTCGTPVDPSMAEPQSAQAKLCVCGAKIVEGAKFCRECGKPVH